MPMINLIQERREAIRSRDRRSRMFFLAFMGVSCLCGLAMGFFALESADLVRQEKDLKKKIKALAPVVQEIKTNEVKVREMTPRLTTLEGAQEKTSRWLSILDHFSRNMPPNTWLTAVRSNDSDPTRNVQLTLVGVSENQERVGEVLLRLQAIPDLLNVALKQTSEKTFGQSKGIEFEVIAEVAESAEEAPKKKATDSKEKA